MSSENPFTAMRAADAPSDGDASGETRLALIVAAEPLWDLLERLPVKADAKLAQRRLQEMVFWGSRAAGGAG